MKVNPHTLLLKLRFKRICCCLTGIMGQNNTAHIQSPAFKLLHQSLYIDIIGDSKITTYFILLNISCIYNNNDLRTVCQLHQHTQLAVRLKAREHSGCMEIIKQLSTKFQIKLIAKFINTFFYML